MLRDIRLSGCVSRDSYFETAQNTERLLSQQSRKHGRSIPASDRRIKFIAVLLVTSSCVPTVKCFVKIGNVNSVTPDFIQGVLTLGHESFSTDKANVPSIGIGISQ